MFALDTNVASELMRPESLPAVETWIAERDAQEMYLGCSVAPFGCLALSGALI